MRIAICDDLPQQLEIINKATFDYFKSNHESIDIKSFSNAFDLLDHHMKTKFDLILLDICMPGILGTEVARELRMQNDQTEIVFLTTSKEFAIDAFEVNAAHYLLKPFTQKAFNQAMDRVIQSINHKLSKMVILKGPKGVVRTVDKNLISYIEADAHTQTVVLNNGTQIEVVQTLSELYQTLQRLSKGQFIIPFKGYIINQHAISIIESDGIVLKNSKLIPIPRRTFHLIKQVYFNYMFGEGE